MPLNPKRSIFSAFDRDSPFHTLTFLFCFLFGIALIANTQAAGDGGWYWYAVLLHNGSRLYADLHLALQPLFVLETSFFLQLLGKSWLASKVPAVLHLLAYSLGLSLLARASNLSDRQKAAVFACAFFCSIGFVANRFDDYHVLADCFQVYSLVLLLRLGKMPGPRLQAILPIALGCLSGLTLMTRLNDGAALLVGVAIAMLFIAHARRLVSLILFGLAALLTIVVIVHLTGDSLHDWASYSIFKAAGSKGGAGNVLFYPLQIPQNAIHFLASRSSVVLTLYWLAATLAWVTLVRPFWQTRGSRDPLKLCAGALIILLPLMYFARSLPEWIPVIVFPSLGALLAYALGAVALLRLLFQKSLVGSSTPWNPHEILLLIPLGQLVSGSMSSGGSPLGLNGPLGIIILLLPIASPIRLKRETAKAFVLTLIATLAILCAVYKYHYPYSWHSYQASRLFVGRTWYQHPEYGAMLIERQDLAFIQPICRAVEQDGLKQGLLSLPYPYPNYFCAIPPWHGYVQTFFDTSSKETIQHLMTELQTSPPKWIVYQRQLYNLGLHEKIFNHGNPLPHRYLDALIEQKLASGQWQSVYTSTYGSNGSFTCEWILIRTRP
jgi:hypothetical protein